MSKVRIPRSPPKQRKARRIVGFFCFQEASTSLLERANLETKNFRSEADELFFGFVASPSRDGWGLERGECAPRPIPRSPLKNWRKSMCHSWQFDFETRKSKPGGQINARFIIRRFRQ